MIKKIGRLLAAVLVIGIVMWGGSKIVTHITSRTAAPQEYQNPRPVITVPYSPYASADLSPTSSVWNTFEKTDVSLLAQVLMIPWGEGVTPSVEVTAIHDNRTLAVRLSWPDEVPNNRLIRNSDRPDGAAIMFPLVIEEAPSSIMMGFLKPVNIWHWKAARRNEGLDKAYTDYYNPNERGTLLATHREDISSSRPGSEIIDNIATMPGTITPKEVQQVSGLGVWASGRWTVTFSRPLQTSSDQDSQIEATGTLPVAFAVWKGEKLERGSRKSISDWILFKLIAREGE